MALNITNAAGPIQNNGVMDAENNTRFTNVSKELFGVAYTVVTLNSIALFVAIVGNSLIFCICMRQDNRKKSFMLYLAALSISDTVACLDWVPPFIALIPGFSWGSPNVHCKLTRFVFNSVQYISSWLVVAISLERTVSTKLPHHVARISSRSFGIKTISIIVLMSFLLNSHTLYGWIGSTNGSIISCKIVTGAYASIIRYFYPVVHALLYSLIPGTLIFLCNTVMVKAVFASARIRGTISDKAAKRNRELMIVAVLISISFVVLTSPFPLYSLFSGVLHDPDVTESKWMAYYLLMVMTYINNAINFFLYILSGSRFRKQLKEIVLCKMCRRN